MHSPGEGFFHPERAVEPDIFTTAAEQIRRQQEQSARQQAAVPHDAAPWPDQPHLKVRLTGEPVADAAWIARLEAHLAGRIDPARLRVASLSDDAPTDRTLDAGLRPAMRGAGRVFERMLRKTPDALDAPRLAAALEAYRGSVLLLIAHIDANRPVIVFRDARGSQREVDLQALQTAEVQAGVDVVLIGCKSAAHRAAGFADSLNSLDAAAAVLRAAAARPASYRELFGQLAGPQLEMLIDPVRFEVHGEMAFTRPGGGEPMSTVRWQGAPSLASVPPAAGPAASAALAPTAESLGPTALDPAVTTARVLLAAVAVLSWLGGVALAWKKLASSPGNAGRGAGGPAGEGAGASARTRVAISHAVWHVAALVVLTAAFAGAVSDHPEAILDAFAAVLICTVLTALLLQAMRGKTSRPALHALNAVRAALVSLPFFLVWLLHERGRETLGEGLRGALRAGYQAMRSAPEIGSALTLAAAGVLTYYFVVSAIDDHVARRKRAAQARAELLAIGVTRPANLASALRAARVFAQEARKRDAGDPCAPSVHPIAEVIAPDPWADGVLRQFMLVKLSFAATSVLGISRAHTRFVHPLPEVLAEAWHRGDVGVAALPRLLALIEPGVKGGDYFGIRRLAMQRLFRIGRWGMLAAALLAAVTAWIVAPSGPEDHFHLWVLGSAAGGAALVGALLLWPARWLLHDWRLARRLHRAIESGKGGDAPQAPHAHATAATAG
ncbi:hypothetical protein BH11PSE9_BH11PSE9_29010 [soil metagenome]